MRKALFLLQKKGFLLLTCMVGSAIILASAGIEFWQNGSLQFWLLSTSFTIERLLPLLGVGLLIGTVPQKPGQAALTFFLASGLAFALWQKDWLLLTLLHLLRAIPATASHNFMVGPLACLITGALLALPARLRLWPGLVLMPALGGFLALAIVFADPSLHDPDYLPSALYAALLMIFTGFVLAKCLPFAFMETGLRIAGSWLFAIGALYGAAYATSRQIALTPPPFVQPAPEQGQFPGFGAVLKDFDHIGLPKALLNSQAEAQDATGIFP